MKNKLTKTIKSAFDINGSLAVDDEAVINSFISNPDFPWLISFSRTGSHWLRMLMELYFEKPALVRIFYFKDAKDFTCYHRHDMDLAIEGIRSVIYLYRNPVETIYSQLNYYKEDTNSPERIRYWAELYGKHLSKWLFAENFTIKKTVITYEGLKNDMHNEFKKVCDHFDKPFDIAKLDYVLTRVSKEEIKKKTKHDKQVINLSENYRNKREFFRKEHGDFVMECVFTQNERLKELIKYSNAGSYNKKLGSP
jgi:hypothetical protein